MYLTMAQISPQTLPAWALGNMLFSEMWYDFFVWLLAKQGLRIEIKIRPTLRSNYFCFYNNIIIISYLLPRSDTKTPSQSRSYLEW